MPEALASRQAAPPGWIPGSSGSWAPCHFGKGEVPPSGGAEACVCLRRTHPSFPLPVPTRPGASRYPYLRGKARHPPARMSYMLPHLHNGWQVDQAILSEEDRVVVIRFGHDWDPTCMKMDEVLYSIAEKVKNFAVIYLVDITEVPDFNKMYELYDPCTVMFFFRNKHIMIDLGTGNNNKINWAMEDKQEMIDIIETVYRGARKGRGLVVSPKDYSTKYRY
ncbi:thioredoxin-like protein 4A isoform X2 [Neopelma chrysocephalum]|uniref:thioredoxin-like protein 4A isoform X2 n=1 Tax=Neopelma chrysocephalum TaxID=114329 RepID=UPI000FCD43D1|nr:thioredoxin-like protein 4A isoform X2 [Neopelma chrysocephalum]